jgi:fermentation-respiration switch protein FrsA (DUF1100 family)
VEYPGYGIYRGSTSTAKVLEDAKCVMEYIRDDLHIKMSDVIIAGRSIGTGPATYVASEYPVGALINISCFKSLKLVARHLFGRIGEYLVKEQFNNLEWMPKVRCPVLLIHGKRDTLVPVDHAESLKSIHMLELDLLI